MNDEDRQKIYEALVKAHQNILAVTGGLLSRILELHQPRRHPSRTAVCKGCEHEGGDDPSFPCTTYLLVTNELKKTLEKGEVTIK